MGTFEDLRSFLNGEIAFWKPHEVPNGEILKRVLRVLDIAASEADSGAQSEEEFASLIQWQRQNRAQSGLLIYSTTPHGDAFRAAIHRNPKAYRGYLDYLCGSIESPRNPDYWDGILSASQTRMFESRIGPSEGLHNAFESLERRVLQSSESTRARLRVGGMVKRLLVYGRALRTSEAIASWRTAGLLR